MADNKHKHLDFIQSAINRMASNSFMLKGWTVTLVSAIFAFAATKENDNKEVFLLIAFIPTIMFWVLDGYFLWQERLFRGVYNEVIKKRDEEIDFEMNPMEFQGGRNTWWASIFSRTLNVFYGILLVMMMFLVLVLYSPSLWAFE